MHVETLLRAAFWFCLGSLSMATILIVFHACLYAKRLKERDQGDE